MKVMITGARGFIGSHVTERLAQDNHTVLAVDNDTSGIYCLNENVTNVAENIITRSKVYTMLYLFKPHVIIHLAAWSNVRESMLKPHGLYKNNLMGCCTIVQCLQELMTERKNPVTYIINASSSAAEPPHSSYYGAAKMAGEHVFSVFEKATLVPVASLRFANIYGPGQNPINGTLIARSIDRLLQVAPIQVYGDGDDRRDYLYISDLVDAICLCLQHTVTGVHNICSGTSWSTNHMAGEILKATRPMLNVVPDPPIVHTPAPAGDKGDVAMEIGDPFKSYHWEPKTDLVSGITKQAAWAIHKPVLPTTLTRQKVPAETLTPIHWL